jgi:arylsulfatase A-like enzyme
MKRRRSIETAALALLCASLPLLCVSSCRGGDGNGANSGNGAAAADVACARLDLYADGLLAEGAVWPHPGVEPRMVEPAQRIDHGRLHLKDGEGLVLQVPGRLLGRARIEVEAAASGGDATLRVFALWALFDELHPTKGTPADFQGRVGTLIQERVVGGGEGGGPTHDDATFQNDPNGKGFLVTIEAPRGGELAIAHVQFLELLPAVVARHNVGGETRPALPIAPGPCHRFELPAAPPGATVELALALPDRMAPRHVPLRVRVLAPGASEGRRDHRFDETGIATPVRRFEDVVLHYPNGTRGKTCIDVELLLEGPAAPTGLAALVAVPRLLPKRDATTPPNVLLLSIDTLRNDRLDDPRGLTPQIAQFARESARFTRCYSPANFTIPAHASMMTGLQPMVHGADRYGDRVSIRAWPNLAGQFTAAGAYAAAFSSGGFVDPAFGFDEHFDRYGTLDPCMSPDNPRYVQSPRRREPEYNRTLHDGQSFKNVARWLDAHQDRRFFLFLHTYFAHDYWPSRDFAARLGTPTESRWPRPVDLPSADFPKVTPGSPQLLWYRGLYDAAVSEVDAALEALFTELRTSGLLDTTVVVVTADHGEAFREHDTLFHSIGLHEEVLHVPLLIHVPGVKAAQVDTPVSLIDLAPTLLELAGAEPLRDVQGTSLVPLLRGGELPERLLIAQDCPPLSKDANGHLTTEITHSALISERWKLIRRMLPGGPVDELYDLLADPLEQRDVAADPANQGALESARTSLERLLGSLQQQAERARSHRATATMSESLNDDLHQLGYL